MCVADVLCSPFQNSSLSLGYNMLKRKNSFLTYNRCLCMRAQSLLSCPTLCNPMDCSLLGSSVHGIFQARMLEWVAISFRSDQSLSRVRLFATP